MSSFNILLADDSVTVQKVVDLTFADEDIDVVSVADGNSAMDRLRESLPDLVMADVNMPGLNGYEICEHVRQMENGQDLPVLLLVGSFEPFDEGEAERVGANGHLTKPFESIGQLVESVTTLLRVTEKQPQAFDDTVEYPTGSNMVVEAVEEAGFTPVFDDDFEDETISTEQFEPEGGDDVDAEPVSFESVEDVAAEAVPEEVAEAAVDWSGSEETYGTEGEPETEDHELVEAADETVQTGHWGEEAETAAQEPDPEPDTSEEAHEDAAWAAPHTGAQHSPTLLTRVEDEQGFDNAGAEQTSQFTTGAETVRLDEADLLELPLGGLEAEPGEPVSGAETSAPAPAASVDEISDELVDRIARKVVERLSEKAVREIAWEVVPEMAELIVKRLAEQEFEK